MYMLVSVLIMCLVTYIPRAIPITFFRKQIKSEFVKDFLYYVPYAVLSALTFPAIFYTSDNIWIALAGTMVAIILSIFNQKLIVVAIMSVFTVFLLGLVL